ncbi:hypothetical protein C8R42DRAFT_724141 [Lentinula raphanica]|nr:hypothetical protein C8R42DRAFT_724141 [Lentinula raphanica]KAJ3825026.1 hypothetical protein F5880DRAFT_1611478 [Lentinula raphanica]
MSTANVGLAPKAGRHSEPHSNPELRTLLKLYSHHELHSRRVGRYIEERDTENFVKGWSRLQNGKLARWIKDTTNAGNDTTSATTASSVPNTDDLEYTPDTTKNSSTADRTLTRVETRTMKIPTSATPLVLLKCERYNRNMDNEDKDD